MRGNIKVLLNKLIWNALFDATKIQKSKHTVFNRKNICHTVGSSLLKFIFCEAQKSLVIGKQLKYEHILQS